MMKHGMISFKGWNFSLMHGCMHGRSGGACSRDIVLDIVKNFIIRPSELVQYVRSCPSVRAGTTELGL